MINQPTSIPADFPKRVYVNTAAVLKANPSLTQKEALALYTKEYNKFIRQVKVYLKNEPKDSVLRKWMRLYNPSSKSKEVRIQRKKLIKAIKGCKDERKKLEILENQLTKKLKRITAKHKRK